MEFDIENIKKKKEENEEKKKQLEMDHKIKMQEILAKQKKLVDQSKKIEEERTKIEEERTKIEEERNNIIAEYEMKKEKLNQTNSTLFDLMVETIKKSKVKTNEKKEQ